MNFANVATIKLSKLCDRVNGAEEINRSRRVNKDLITNGIKRLDGSLRIQSMRIQSITFSGLQSFVDFH